MGARSVTTSSRTNADLVVGYIRVSTDTDRQALGAQAQAAALQEWANKNGAALVQSFVEQVSGGASIERRPVLLEAIATVAAVGASGLLVAKLDRFSRCPVSAALAESELRKHGSRLICADGNGD